MCMGCDATGACTVPLPAGDEDTVFSHRCMDTSACDGAGNCKKANGQSCGDGGECALGHCVDGTCCVDDCTTPCKSCANSSGTCTSNVAKYDEDVNGGCFAAGGEACNGAGLCKKANGQVCGNAGDCASGFCVDGTCCESACTTTCKSCANASGTCTTNVGQFVDDLNSSPACTGASTCNGAGSCKLKLGQVCGSDPSLCASGFCGDGFCCNSACTEGCKACDLPTLQGTCSPVAKGSEETGCSGTQAYDGAGGCKKKSGQSCGGATECVSGQCVDSTCCVDDCAAACYTCANAQGTCAPVAKGLPDTGCAGTEACDGAGHCRHKDGQACTDPTDCVSGNCVDTVCCDTPCTAVCHACRANLKASAANSGQCGLAAAGVDPRGNCNAEAQTTCGQDGECNGSGWCRKWGYGTSCDTATFCDGNTVRGRICNGDSLCIDNTSGVDCGLHVCRGGGCINPCNADADCVAGNWCNASACVAKQADGTACAEGRQCTSTFCVDGVCCDTLCNGLCQACKATLKVSGADGACGNAAAGLDPHDQCPDDGAESCDRNGVCDGTGQCATYPATFTCKPPSCDQGARVTWACDGSGTCQGTPASCGAYACVAGVCASTCGGDGDCSSDAYCAGTTCTAKLANGTACTEGRVCRQGFCADGVCCSAACAGQCEACAEPGLVGTCSPVDGAPRGGRAQCATATGSDPCAARACKGASGTSECLGYVGSSVPCREQRCADGVETMGASCEGTGFCPALHEVECTPYVCQGDRCGAEPCLGDEDCAAEFKCKADTGRCVARDVATCDGEHTVTAPDGTTETDCTPYTCEVGAAGGVCKDHCNATTDCVTGYVCDTLQGQGVCVTSNPDPGNQGGGCAAAGRDPVGPGGAAPWFLLALLLGGASRVRRAAAGRARR
jgi:hypothetical protein